MKNSLQDKNVYNIKNQKAKKLGRFEIVLDLVDKKGDLYPYSYIKQKNSVGILPFCEDKILLINQYRHAHKKYMLEIPGGGIEENEKPEFTAQKELFEETGYVCDDITFLGEYYPSPGSSNEVTYLFYANCHNIGFTNKEDLELIENVLVSEDELEQKIMNGQIGHSMCLVAWLMYKMKRGKNNVD